MEPQNNTINYLIAVRTLKQSMSQMQGFEYSGMEDFILREGSVWHRKASHRYSKRPYKACFHNSMLLAHKHEKLTYVEGIAENIIPMHHAWCVDEDGKIIDVTWNPDEGTNYVGVPFTRSFISQRIVTCRKNNHWSLLDDYLNRWNLYRFRADSHTVSSFDTDTNSCYVSNIITA